MTHFTEHHKTLRSLKGFSFPQTLLNPKLFLFIPFLSFLNKINEEKKTRRIYLQFMNKRFIFGW